MIFTLGCGSDAPMTEAAREQPEATPTGPGPGPGPMARRGGGGGGMHGEKCPMEVAGATVRAEETPSGAALVFTTTGDTDELRRRAREMAAQHATMGGRMSDVPVSVEDVEGGARLVFAPAEADQQAMREHAQLMAERMRQSGTCPMIGHEGS